MENVKHIGVKSLFYFFAAEDEMSKCVLYLCFIYLQCHPVLSWIGIVFLLFFTLPNTVPQHPVHLWKIMMEIISPNIDIVLCNAFPLLYLTWSMCLKTSCFHAWRGWAGKLSLLLCNSHPRGPWPLQWLHLVWPSKHNVRRPTPQRISWSVLYCSKRFLYLC